MEVKTQPLPNPDTSKKEIRYKLFHENNFNENLNYSENIYTQFQDLKNQLSSQLNLDSKQFWNQDIQQIYDMIQDVGDDQLKTDYLFQYEKIKDQSINLHKSNHFLKQYIQNLLLQFLDELPQLVDDEKQQKELPENFKFCNYQDKEYIQQIIPEIKSLKKFKTEEEKHNCIKEMGDEMFLKINNNLINKFTQAFEKKYTLKLKKQKSYYQNKFFSEHIDKISRKYNLDVSLLEGQRALVLYTFELNKKDLKNTQKDQQQNIENEQITIDNLCRQQIEEFIELLYYFENQPLKYTQLYVQIMNINKIFNDCSIKFLYDFIKSETEVNIQWESSNIITSYEEKLQNDYFEDGCILLCENPYQQIELKSRYLDHFNIRRSTQYINNYYEFKRLMKQNDILIDCDKRNLFQPNRLSSVFIQNIRIFGPNIQKSLDFIRKYNNQNQFQENNFINNILVIGGNLTLKKIYLMIFAQNYYEKIIVSGIIGLKFLLYNQKINTDYLNDKDFQCLDYLYENIEDKNKIVFPNGFQYIELDSEDENFLRDAQNQNQVNVQNYQKYQEILDLKQKDYQQNEFKDFFVNFSNTLQFTKNQISKQDEEQIQTEKGEEKNDENEQQKTYESIQKDQQEKIIQKYFVTNFDDEFLNKVYDLIKSSDSVLLIDNISLHSEFVLDKISENLMQFLEKHYEIFSNFEQNKLKEKISICGTKMIEKINEYQFSKVQKIKQILQKKKEQKNQQKQKKNQNNDQSDNESNEVQTDGSQLQSDYEDLESQESEQDSDDENEELSQNVNKLSHNTSKDCRLLLNILTLKYSDKLYQYNEKPKLIVDPDDKDFSFLDELDQINLYNNYFLRFTNNNWSQNRLIPSQSNHNTQPAKLQSFQLQIK